MTATTSHPVGIRLPPSARARYHMQGIGYSAGLRRDLERYERLLRHGRMHLHTWIPAELIRELVTRPELYADADALSRDYSIITDDGLRPIDAADLIALIDAAEQARGLITAGVSLADALARTGLTTNR